MLSLISFLTFIGSLWLVIASIRMYFRLFGYPRWRQNGDFVNFPGEKVVFAILVAPRRRIQIIKLAPDIHALSFGGPYRIQYRFRTYGCRFIGIPWQWRWYFKMKIYWLARIEAELFDWITR